jgi:hypothetical protein
MENIIMTQPRKEEERKKETVKNVLSAYFHMMSVETRIVKLREFLEKDN